MEELLLNRRGEARWGFVYGAIRRATIRPNAQIRLSASAAKRLSTLLPSAHQRRAPR